MIEFVLADDYDDMSRKAADIISAQILVKSDCVLGLATGGTPVGIYACLAEKYSNGELDFSQITSLNLDEFRGLSRDDENSYFRYMYDHLFSKVNIDMNRAFVPDGSIENADEACQRYEKIIADTGGIDLQLLGLGHNGHIGFNEPSDIFPKRTHLVNLAESTIRANSRFFVSEKDMPKQAYTMGIGNIMESKKILMAVSGADKADIVRKAFFGDITPTVPASVLQLHQNVTVVGDKAAFSEITDLI